MPSETGLENKGKRRWQPVDQKMEWTPRFCGPDVREQTDRPQKIKYQLILKSKDGDDSVNQEAEAGVGGDMQKNLRGDRAGEGMWTLLARTSSGQVSAFTCQGCLGQGGQMSKEKKDFRGLIWLPFGEGQGVGTVKVGDLISPKGFAPGKH